MYFRAFYGVPESVTAPDGMPVNAVRGFTDMVSTLITRYRPTHLVACLDYDWRPAFRVELIPAYKAHRVAVEAGSGQHPDGVSNGGPDVEEAPDTLTPQVPVLLEVLAAAGLCAVGAVGFEADDVIATLADRYDRRGVDVDVVSGDRDLIGVVTDRVRVLYTGRGMSKIAELDPGEVERVYGVPADRYPDFAVLRGDPSDGLPGVPGVGAKTAVTAVNQFGSIERLLAAARDGASPMAAPLRKKILAAADYLAVAPQVVRGRTDCPVGELDCAIPAEPVDPGALAELTRGYGIASAVERLRKALASVG